MKGRASYMDLPLRWNIWWMTTLLIYKDIRNLLKPLIQKEKYVNLNIIIEYYGSNSLYKNNDIAQQMFLEDIVPYIAKWYIALSVVENPWLWRLVLRRDLNVRFPIKNKWWRKLFHLYCINYQTFCIAGLGKLCNSFSDFPYVDVAYRSEHILFGCELHK